VKKDLLSRVEEEFSIDNPSEIVICECGYRNVTLADIIRFVAIETARAINELEDNQENKSERIIRSS
jgi:hypothetical protein